MGLDTSLKGKAYSSYVYLVSAEAIHLYASATNETNPAFAGDPPIGSPAFPIVAASKAIGEVLVDPDLQANMARLVQAEESHVFHAPIRAGDELTVTSMLETVEAGDAGESFSIITTLGAAGQVAVELRSRMVIRGTGLRSRAASAPPKTETPPPDVLFEATETVDEDQTYRYAEASGDRNLIHTDPDFAKNTAGLPGIIVHGMCTMAFACRAVLDGAAAGDPLRLRSVTVEFARPVFPGQTLTTRGWLEPDSAPEGGYQTFGFETLNPRGQQVIKSGRAEINP